MAPALAAKRLYGDWRSGERAAALQIATTQAVTELFSRPSRAEMFEGCERRESGSGFICSFSFEAGATNMLILGTASAGYHVESVRFEIG